MPSPQHQLIVDALRAAGDPTVEPTVAWFRAVLDGMAERYPPPTGTTVTPAVLGGVGVERIDAPGLDGDPATVLHLHGGGYVAGSVAFGRSLCARVGAHAGASVVSVDYRLAPEHTYPAALDDALAAYRGLIAGGTPPARLVLLGDSTGGGLAYSMLLALRDAGDPLPAGAVLLSPWVDLDLTGESIRTRAAEDVVLSPALLALAAASYRPDGSGDALSSPLGWDPAGLPPLLVLVGTAEILLDDARRLAERTRAAGVDTTYEEGEGLIHEWPLFAEVPEAAEAVTRIATWIRERLAAG